MARERLRPTLSAQRSILTSNSAGRRVDTARSFRLPSFGRPPFRRRPFRRFDIGARVSLDADLQYHL
jgi:hypothetical protein